MKKNLLLVPSPVIFSSPLEKWKESLEGTESYLLTSDNASGEFPKDGTFFEIEKFPNYENNDNLMLRALKLSQSGIAFDRVLSISEFDLLRSAKIRGALQIEGQTYENALLFRDKAKMKERAKLHGIDVPKFQLATDPFQIENFRKSLNSPIVIKPPMGSGSEDTFVIRTDRDFQQFLETKSTTGHHRETVWMLEEFIEGQMFHIDGLVLDSKPVFILPAQYLSDCLAYQNGKVTGSYLLSNSNPLFSRLVAYTNDLLDRVFPVPSESLFHLEVFLTPDNRLVFCEIASRIGGGRIGDTIKAAHGFDMKMEYVKAICRGKESVDRSQFTLSDRLAGHVMIPPQKGVLKARPTECPLPWVKSYKPRGNLEQQYDGPHSSVDQVASFIVEGASEQEVLERLNKVSCWFATETVWQLQ